MAGWTDIEKKLKQGWQFKSRNLLLGIDRRKMVIGLWKIEDPDADDPTFSFLLGEKFDSPNLTRFLAYAYNAVKIEIETIESEKAMKVMAK